ncbi:MAG: hypothetical protein ACP5LX_06625 [Nitrososphaeria archaeon]|nr:hypothetical protein [TACK group archaeon]
MSSAEEKKKLVRVVYPFQVELKDKKYISVKEENGLVRIKFVDQDGSWHMLVGPLVVEVSVL